MHLLENPGTTAANVSLPERCRAGLLPSPGDGPQPSPNASSRRPVRKRLHCDFTVLCGPQGPWETAVPAGQPPSSSLPQNRCLLCVPEEMAHISLPLVLLAVQLFAPIHLPPETTGRGNEEGELIRKGREARAQGGKWVEPKGIGDVGVSVRAPEPGGSQS